MLHSSLTLRFDLTLPNERVTSKGKSRTRPAALFLLDDRLCCFVLATSAVICTYVTHTENYLTSNYPGWFSLTILLAGSASLSQTSFSVFQSQSIYLSIYMSTNFFYLTWRENGRANFDGIRQVGMCQALAVCHRNWPKTSVLPTIDRKPPRAFIRKY